MVDRESDLLSLEEGITLVRVARLSVKHYLKHGEVFEHSVENPRLLQKRGVFSTVKEVLNGDFRLRGCIGFPMPVKPVADAVVESSTRAATQDPRFPPLELGDLARVVFSISVLSPIQPLRATSPLRYPRMIKVGRDGLMISWRSHGGVLLPEVPVEQAWDEEEYLAHVCMKAGLPPDAWLTNGPMLSSFTAQVFEERNPDGRIEEKGISRGSSHT